MSSTKHTIKIPQLNCPSCAAMLDIQLEEIHGIISSHTNYVKSEVTIEFDPKIITLEFVSQEVIGKRLHKL